ncbi:hypothetical protein BGW38_010959 [Lunasporangiospora selenospora]|uniref:Symplekin n=1 Tax=Lunasporangiospora selenospora TaxID=979761 RepID=A0A9P6KEJ2_9FUNG|nr:hypothetical protein BGW38_010959 [Lunasporangiospora selenospora]
MSNTDIQLTLQAHLNHATLATNAQDLNKHLDAFTRDWRLEPSLEQFDTVLGLLRDSRRLESGETVALWWLNYVHELVLNDHIDPLSTELIDVLYKLAEPLGELINSPSEPLIKQSILASAAIYSVVFRICCQEQVNHHGLWKEYGFGNKQHVLGHLKGNREGVLMSVGKYIQIIVQTQSYSQPNSASSASESMSLNKIPANHPFLDVEELQAEADRLLEELLAIIHRPSISPTIVTALINQASALLRARPQFIPLILMTMVPFSRLKLPTLFPPSKIRFIEKAVRIQLLSISKMHLQPPQVQALTDALSAYGINYNGGPLSRQQHQQLLHLDKEGGEDSRRSSKRSRSSNQDNDEVDAKRSRPDLDSRSSNTPTLPPPAPPLLPAQASSGIPPGFGQTLLSQITITELPVHHVVDVILENLVANGVPHLFHSFLAALPKLPLKPGPLPIPPPGVGPPPPGLLLPPHPFPPPGMGLPPPGGAFPPPQPPSQPIPHAEQQRPDNKAAVKKELSLAKLQLPTVSGEEPVKVVVMPPRHTPVRLPSRPVVAKSDAVTVGSLSHKGGLSEPEIKKEPKVEPEVSQQQLKQETLQVKPFEYSERQGVTAGVNAVVVAGSGSTETASELLKDTFLRILASERLVSIPGTTGRKMLEAAVQSRQPVRSDPGPSEAESSQGAVVRSDNAKGDRTSMAVTKTDWMTIIARLLARAFPRSSGDRNTSRDQGMKAMMIDYICADFKQRRELALIWLHEEWYYDSLCQRKTEGGDEDLSMEAEDADREPQYLWCLYKILDGITSDSTPLDVRDRGLTRFLLEVPELPEGAVDIIQNRDRALQIVLEYTAHLEKLQRSIAIVTARKWYMEHPTVGSRVEQYALSQLESLKDFVVPRRGSISAPATNEPQQDVTMQEGPSSNPDIKIEEGEGHQGGEHEGVKMEVDGVQHPPVPGVSGPTMSEQDRAVFAAAEDGVGRQLELYFSLCAKNHELLGVLLLHYASFDPFVQRVIRQRIQPLIKSIKSDSVKLFGLIRNFNTGAEMLVLRIVMILTDGVRPSPGLVSAVQDAVNQHDLNARFLIPIIGGLNKEEVLASLPRIVGLLKGTDRERKTVTDVFLKLLTGNSGSGAGPMGTGSGPVGSGGTGVGSGAGIGAGTGAGSSRGPVLSPSELLIELHSMENVVGWRTACEAMDICFHHPEIYKSEIIAVVLQQLLDRPTIPSLFMRTVIQSITMYKNLVGFVNSMILARLVSKKVWERPVLWKGFIRCAKLMQPTSSSVLASLPKPQLKEILNAEPSLKESVEAYLKAKSSGRRVGGGVTKQVNVHNVAQSMQTQPQAPTLKQESAPVPEAAKPGASMDASEPLQSQRQQEPDSVAAVVVGDRGQGENPHVESATENGAGVTEQTESV